MISIPVTTQPVRRNRSGSNRVSGARFGEGNHRRVDNESGTDPAPTSLNAITGGGPEMLPR